jgi:MFS family permease
MLRMVGMFQINALYFGLNMLSITNGFIVPLLVQQIVGGPQQGAYFGQLRLWSLMIAILAQSLMGTLSDGSSLPWGRRRPFILIGAVLTLALLWLVGASPLLHGEGSYAFLFIAIILIQIGFNTTNAGQNGFIPDLLPESQHGIAAGVKALLEIPLPLAIVALFIGPLISQGDLWQALQIAMLIFLLTSLVALTIKETAAPKGSVPFKWSPFVRLALMTGYFAIVILVLGELVRLAARWPVYQASDLLQPITLGIVGLASIILALFAGAWISLRIGLGKTALQENPSYGWWILHRLAFLTAMLNMSVFSLYFIQARLGISGELAAGPGAIFLALLGILIAISTLPSGWLADRYGKKPLAMLGCLVICAGTALLLVTTRQAVMMAGGGLIGVGAGMVFSASWAIGTELAPKGQAGKYLGIQNLAAAGAGAVGAYLGGPIADYFSLYFPHLPGVGYLVLYAMFGGLCLLSAAALWQVREKL